ncbi:MAG: nicotinate (nicotinamide) nucleotide adenylyltransferase [Planctomycetota bacterium]
MRIVFGGSFDPVHRGHLAMADAAQEHCQPEEILWVPSRHAPHKPDEPPAGGDARLAFLETVVGPRDSESVCTLELHREGLSFTVDTLRQLEELHPESSLAFLLGGDSLSHLATWRDLEELFTRVEFLFVPRTDWGPERLDPFLASLDAHPRSLFRARFLPMGIVDCSSTEIRQALDQGHIPESVPEPVAALIQSGQHYGFSA